ncbi:hypothetical protein ElyMa_004278400 [Elysia marginata]|uniref:Uncharacterized protein n=1 Tax=Elysia marginata TaxID=1093978 RepID=A0AAV4GVJ7_9GAST|nr:hypothetical protein ElyMa_004278400 [Elysia marginata]
MYLIKDRWNRTERVAWRDKHVSDRGSLESYWKGIEISMYLIEDRRNRTERVAYRDKHVSDRGSLEALYLKGTIDPPWHHTSVQRQNPNDDDDDENDDDDDDGDDDDNYKK